MSSESAAAHRDVRAARQARLLAYTCGAMIERISHSRSEESIEAKARWFQSLSAQERMDLLCWYTDLALEANPDLARSRNAQSTTGRIRVLSAA